MTYDTDHTLPGKAGLYFQTDDLTPAGWQQEHEARARLERWCAYCGQRSSYGFGETLQADGILTCSDASCIASAEAEIARRHVGAEDEHDCLGISRHVPSPLAKPSDDNPITDLFGEAA